MSKPYVIRFPDGKYGVATRDGYSYFSKDGTCWCNVEYVNKYCKFRFLWSAKRVLNKILITKDEVEII